MISGKLKALSAAFALHAVVVVLGASNIRLHHAGAVGEIVTWYGALTGAERGFGFFAPAVNTQARTVFTLTDTRGNEWVETMGQHSTDEGRLRMNNLAAKFWRVVDGDNVRLKRSLAASWAAEVFRRHPRAARIRLTLQLYRIPSMTNYRRGERPGWTPIYEATFQRGARYASNEIPSD